MDIDTTTPTGAVGRLELREGGPSAMRDVILRAQVRVQTALYSIRHRQEGQGLVEYGLIIASIAILLIVAMLFLAGKIDDLFSETGSSVESGGPLP
jgi:pilus assembly protein Flp/PilA